jgi:hypothetical protein
MGNRGGIAADAYSEDQPPIGSMVQAGNLIGQEHRMSQHGEKHRGTQAHSLRARRNGG